MCKCVALYVFLQCFFVFFLFFAVCVGCTFPMSCGRSSHQNSLSCFLRSRIAITCSNAAAEGSASSSTSDGRFNLGAQRHRRFNLAAQRDRRFNLAAQRDRRCRYAFTCQIFQRTYIISYACLFACAVWSGFIMIMYSMGVYDVVIYRLVWLLYGYIRPGMVTVLSSMALAWSCTVWYIYRYIRPGMVTVLSCMASAYRVVYIPSGGASCDS